MGFKIPVLSFVVIALLTVFAVACGDDDDGGSAAGNGASGEITVYSGRSESLVDPLIRQFERDTGVTVQVRYAGSAELAATIQEEGDATPADVFWSQDPGPLGALSDRFLKLPDQVLERVDAGFKSDEGKWVGLSGRVRVVVYNPERVDVADLPQSLEDLTAPEWRDRVGWAPTNGSFQIMVTAFRVLKGDDAASQWLEAMSDNGTRAYGNNNAVLTAVAAGEVDVGLINHYYLHAARRSNPDITAENHYMNNSDDPGSLVMVSGAGILANTDNRAAAERFVEYMLSDSAQQYFATQTSEYPVTNSVITPANLLSFEEINGPRIDFSSLADIQGTLELLRQTGVVQ
ncbi:MAG TPA: iron ABC transporter substrate-binding protein [Dehalococcoidia bacterium]|nr:iron ABC transporter substrate-binding protein [Dehalococcoidia bacterium]